MLKKRGVDMKICEDLKVDKLIHVPKFYEVKKKKKKKKKGVKEPWFCI